MLFGTLSGRVRLCIAGRPACNAILSVFDYSSVVFMLFDTLSERVRLCIAGRFCVRRGGSREWGRC